MSWYFSCIDLLYVNKFATSEQQLIPKATEIAISERFKKIGNEWIVIFT